MLYVCFALGTNVHSACVLHFYICICSAQLRMSCMENHYRKKIIITVVIEVQIFFAVSQPANQP